MLNIVFTGHVDHGKSTLVGRLFYDCGQISERVMDRLKRHAESVGKPSFSFAYFTDNSLKERERGISIETSYKGLETNNRIFNIIDSPGHKDFVKNMISGAIGADCAVLVVDVNDTISNGILPQTQEHLLILKAVHIEKIIVAINKIDTVDYNEQQFEQCKLEIQYYCEKINFKAGLNATYIPISALKGENIIRSSKKMLWYDGPTFLDLLNSLPCSHEFINLPLRMPILRTFNVSGVGTVVAGKIEFGQIKTGDSVVIVPYPGFENVQAVVKSIKWQHKQMNSASVGDEVGILLSKLQKGFVVRNVKKGSILSCLKNPPKITKRFKAKIEIVDQSSKFKIGYTPYIHVHQAALPCKIVDIVSISNNNKNEKMINKDNIFSNNYSAEVWIVPLKPLVIESAFEFPKLGYFILRDGRTVAIGKCLEVDY